MGNYPRFFGKDSSNLPDPPPSKQQPTLFEMLNEAENIMRATEHELEQLNYDIQFLLIIAENFRG